MEVERRAFTVLLDEVAVVKLTGDSRHAGRIGTIRNPMNERSDAAKRLAHELVNCKNRETAL